jgi:outer membrane lipoprotein-sorting protein
MLRFLIIFILLNFYNPAFSSIKEKIISQMKLTNILSFNFTQTIDEKIEKGSCIIKYPKKIFCSYDGSNNKVIVSNGKSLVIKIKNSGNYYIYPLNKTPLDLLLDKEYLISKISTIEGRIIYDKFLTFKIFENKNKINIFFDVKTFNLVGWQTEDIYQNLNITFISSIKINEKIDDKIFILPTND